MARVDFRDPAQNLRAFVKLLGDLDPSKVAWSWFGGHVFAVSGTKPAQMLCGVEGFGVLRCEPRPDGKYRVLNRELAFYSNPYTGQYLDVWKNPLTGEDCEVHPIHNHYVGAELAPVMKMDFEGTMREFPFTPPWTVLGDDVFQTFEVHTAYPSPMKPKDWPRESAGDVMRIGEMFQRTAKLAQIEDDSLTSTHYTGTWTRIGPWLPWMLMGQRQGHLFYRSHTLKLSRVEDLPKDILAYTEKRFPKYLTAPREWVEPNVSSFEMYARDRKPLPVSSP